MKQMQQLTLYNGMRPQGAAKLPQRQPRPLRSTAAIFANGISLSKVLQAVDRLRPRIQQLG